LTTSFFDAQHIHTGTCGTRKEINEDCVSDGIADAMVGCCIKYAKSKNYGGTG
jgi:hypothetical protein